ncbi:MAG: GlsB/YeaQ/YmgE family stress response membrane protein [Planctomycetota bacterium]
MSHFIGQIIFGFIVGVIAKFLMPGRDPGGCIITILLGIGGSVLTGWLARTYLPQIGVLGQWGGAIAGALLILIIYRMIFGEPKS